MEVVDDSEEWRDGNWILLMKNYKQDYWSS